MSSAEVIGFGGRTPEKLLKLLSQCVSNEVISEVIPSRSQNVELALLKAPYRTFLQNSTSDASGQKKNLIVYALPTSISEYLSSKIGVEEANYVRSKAVESLTTNNDSIILTFDIESDSFCGASNSETDVQDIVKSLTGECQNNNYTSATLSALSSLDKKTHDFYTNGAGKGDTVLVVGSGGREHALAVALARSPLVSQVLCCPGNGGTALESTMKNSKIKNIGSDQKNSTIIELVQTHDVGLVCVGPEAPLVDGLVNELSVKCPKVKAFGPTKEAAELEASKAFTKDFLKEYDIPTASYENFTDVNKALAYVESLSLFPESNKKVVVKASGLAAGKGVLLPNTKAEALDAVKEIMSDKAFGNAGDTCVVESFLTGPEASCLALCDGNTAKLMPAAQDHKRALDNDEGLNTGGMGAYAPAPCVTPALQDEIEKMCQKTVEKMKERGTPYVGVLYAGMMLTPDGPYVLEFNCRFGDPETQVVLPLLETDLYETMCACCDGTLDKIDLRFKENQSAVTVVCAAKGYPEKYPKGMVIEGLPELSSSEGDVKVYHAGTKLSSQDVLCSGGRVLAVTGLGKDLKEALSKSYGAVKNIKFTSPENGESLMHYRTDIAKKAMQKRLRLGVMGSTRGTALLPVMKACSVDEGEEAEDSSNDLKLYADITAVLSNRKSAPILEKGKSLGEKVVTTKYVKPSKTLSRREYDAECTSVLIESGVELVLLIGYMRILSPEFCQFWQKNIRKCYNVHPSLLPKFAGAMDLDVHQQVLDAKETESGCSIHEVTEEVDGGRVVVQKKVTVDPEKDTAESLKARVQPLEGLAFIEAVSQYCQAHNIGPVSSKEKMTYADAGVDIHAGNSLVELIKPLCKSTKRSGCDADLGGFGGLFDLEASGYGDGKNTILIGATDGVGTKLVIAQSLKIHDYVGIDLVAMCVNDLIVAGGEPLFFLDYYATGKLEVEEAGCVVKGIAEGCRQANCGLIGGETAEMPSMYKEGDYDLAGFAVGAVHRDRVLPKNVSEGDVLLGLASNGIHSNGFSLVRKLVEREEGLSFESPCPWDEGKTTVGQNLLTPTKIYVRSCVPLLKAGVLNGMSHITGGGLLENLPRSLPKGIVAEITGHPPLPPVFKWMKEKSGLDDPEMLTTFNCGIGMILIVPKDKVDEAKSLLSQNEEVVYDLGVLVKGDGEQVVMKCDLA